MSRVIPIDGPAVLFSDRPDPEAARMLRQADAASDPEVKGEILRKAVAAHPHALDAHVALYKFHFRTGAFRDAERAVWHALIEVARQGGFGFRYNRLTRDTAPWLTDKSVARIYLFSLKALGVVRLRRGRVAAAERVLTKLLELDPRDEIGGSNFLGIARSFHDEDAA
jgi:hypothetical protein